MFSIKISFRFKIISESDNQEAMKRHKRTWIEHPLIEVCDSFGSWDDEEETRELNSCELIKVPESTKIWAKVRIPARRGARGCSHQEVQVFCSLYLQDW